MQSTTATPQIFISGRITEASNFDSQEIFIKLDIVHGTNMKIIEGKAHIETFQGLARLDERKVYFDHPFNINMACRSVKGWPKFLIEVWSTDEHGRNHLIGYGTKFLPFAVGCKRIDIPCWRPIEGNTSSLAEYFLGNTPEYIDKSAIYSSDEKFGMHSVSTGNIGIELDLIAKDFHLHGINFK